MTHEQPAREVDCDGALERLFDFLDREVDADLERGLRAHLDGCRHCFDTAEFERRFLGALQASRAAAECPQALRERVFAALRHEGMSE